VRKAGLNGNGHKMYLVADVVAKLTRPDDEDGDTVAEVS
jgi:hypothetical protein